MQIKKYVNLKSDMIPLSNRQQEQASKSLQHQGGRTDRQTHIIKKSSKNKQQMDDVRQYTPILKTEESIHTHHTEHKQPHIQKNQTYEKMKPSAKDKIKTESNQEECLATFGQRKHQEQLVKKVSSKQITSWKQIQSILDYPQTSNQRNFDKMLKAEYEGIQNFKKSLLEKNEVLTKLVERQKNPQVLNFELQQFVREKGNDYLKQLKEQGRTLSLKKINHQGKDNINKQDNKTGNRSRIKTESQSQSASRYKNYLPEVFPHRQASSRRQSSKNEKESEKQKIALPQISPMQKKYLKINDREEMLGKIVWNNVQDYFELEKDPSARYFKKVQTEEKIDKALMEYLRTKMDRADYVLSVNEIQR